MRKKIRNNESAIEKKVQFGAQSLCSGKRELTSGGKAVKKRASARTQENTGWGVVIGGKKKGRERGRGGPKKKGEKGKRLTSLVYARGRSLEKVKTARISRRHGGRLSLNGVRGEGGPEDKLKER